MATIGEIRQQYPQYNDMSDKELADAFHGKFYSDIPKEDFYKTLGVKSAAPAAPQSRTEMWKAEGKKLLTRADDLVRGVADTVTFGYADEIAAKLDQLTGINTGKQGGPAPKTYDEALASQRARDSEASGFRTAGQVGGALIPVVKGAQLADKALRAVNIIPTATKVAAVTGAAGGGLYGTGSADGDLTDRALGGVMGAATGAVLGAGGAKVVDKATNLIPSVRADRLAQKPFASMDAEVVADLAKVATRETVDNPTVLASQAKQVGRGYVEEAKSTLQEAGFKQTKEMKLAFKQKDVITQEALDKIRAQPGGEAVADAITKYQRLIEMTKPETSTGGASKVARGVVDWVLPNRVASAVNSVIGSRVTTEKKVADLITPRNLKANELVADRLGPSAATQSMDDLKTLAQQNMAKVEAARQKAIAEAAKKEAADATTRIEVLRDTRMPLGGAFKELLPGGKSNLNLSSDEAVKALRLLAKKGGVIGEGAQKILKSPNALLNDDVFYGIQNKLLKLQEKGLIGGKPPVKNQAAYNAKVIENTIRDVMSKGE